MGDLIDHFVSYAYRVDQEQCYAADASNVERWIAGDRTPLPEAHPEVIPAYLRWLDHLANTNRTLHRLRVIDSPPTDWQRWMRWAVRWPMAHGERITFVERKELPAIDHQGDWWLFDGHAVVDIDHDGDGRASGYRLRSDPDLIRSRLEWWDTVVQQKSSPKSTTQ